MQQVLKSLLGTENPATLIVPLNPDDKNLVALCIQIVSQDRTSPIIFYADPFGKPMPSGLKNT